MTGPTKTLTIQDASKRSGLSPHTLRFWEKELQGIIVPQRTKGGQRRYTLGHLLIIEEIKNLKSKGLSLTAIRAELNHRFNTDEENHSDPQADMLAGKIAEIVRSVLSDYLNGKKGRE
jgi:DNA-binding transcriptional MerR regulator